MASKEDILGQFELFNIKPSEDVLSKCLEMCLKYHVDGEDFVDQWFAYTSSVLRGAAPTVEYLEQMERKVFAKSKNQDSKKHGTDQMQHIRKSPLAEISNRPTSPIAEIALSTPKQGNHTPVSRITTPIQAKKLLAEPMDVDGSYKSPSAPIPSTPSKTYSARTGRGSVRCSYGPLEAKFARSHDIDLVVKPFYDDGLKPYELIGYEKIDKRKKCIDTLTEDLFGGIVVKHHLRVRDEKEHTESSDDTLLYGRIVSDTGGKLTTQTVSLVQTKRLNGRRVSLKLSKLPKCTVFSGQVAAVKGILTKNLDKKYDELLVEEVFVDTNFNLLDEPPLIKETLQLVIACGPFTVQENLRFEPLTDLLDYVKKHKPHVLFLVGPFYDRNHVGLKNGELKQLIESFYLELINDVMTEVPQSTHVIVVSSMREANQVPVYPTPPCSVRENYPNLTVMPDPCMVNINGMVVGTTSADILFDIGSAELFLDRTNSGPPDRMARLASYLLAQQCFYPLDPPGKGTSIDFSLMARHGVMEVKPHILILPSNFRHFIKEIDNCLVINPERLTKGNSGGTFTRIEVYPGSNPTVCGRAACQILSI